MPVTAKIRLLPELEDTLAFARMLEEAGVAALAVHGRLRTAKHDGPADWVAIAAVKSALRIPVISNGDVRCKADADACLAQTGVDAVMSASALLSNPRVFAAAHGSASLDGGRPTPCMRREMALEYLECCKRHPTGALPRMMSDHLNTILFRGTAACASGAGLDARRSRVKATCKRYLSLRTPAHFAERVVRALERIDRLDDEIARRQPEAPPADAPIDAPPAEPTATSTTIFSSAPALAGRRSGSRAAAKGGGGPTPSLGAAQRPPAKLPPDAMSVQRAVRRGALRRRRAAGLSEYWAGRGCCVSLSVGLTAALCGACLVLA